MKISDLKVGDITTRRNGSVVVINDNEKLKQKFNDDLTHKTTTKYDIMKVQRYVPYKVNEISRTENGTNYTIYYGDKGVDDVFRLETIYERKEEILDDKEKEYLRGVIKPFRNRIIDITKYTIGKQNSDEIALYIAIRYIESCNKCGVMPLPSFKNYSMYKNMITGKNYTLEELGL